MKIEILTSASGVDFDECYQRRKIVRLEDMEIPFIGFEDLITNKRSSARTKDVADIENLGKEKG